MPHGGGTGSLSARRAWIEINIACATGFSASVALRKESVDRNLRQLTPEPFQRVALRKESVDRNAGHDPAAAAAI